MAEKPQISGVRMKLSSPERVRELSSGEIKKPETINYRTLRPEKDGLFCERIFGPTRSFECACGKYKRSGQKFKGVICDRCGVEVTDNRVRRDRMGHIELAAPVVHIWYLRGIPSRLSLLLGTPTKDLEKVVYFAPARKREPKFKVVSDGKRPDLVKRGDLITSGEERVHRHYDPKFAAEEAYRITKVDDIPVDMGDVIPASQAKRIKDDFGEELFKAEKAFRAVRDDGEGEVFPESQLERMKELKPDAEFAPVRIQNSESFCVTLVVHLPFSKGDVVSKSEYSLYHHKYPDRFVAQPETEIIEDPCAIVIDGGDSPFERSDTIFENEAKICASYDKGFTSGIGAEGVYTLLQKIDINELVGVLREQIADSSGQKKRKLVKRLQIAEDFRKSSSLPEWMILSVLPVIPPDLRPMVQLDGGRFATSDLNDLYRRVINRNNRLKKLQELRAPDIIIRNEKRMLQESVDALIDNGRRGKAVLGAGNRPLKSLTDLLRGKKGRFRQNLLGKRVDYSGRSVIVIGPTLKIYQCGLPKQMALELFKPFVMNKLVEENIVPNVKSARRYIDRGRDEVWGVLETIIKDHPVMLNRAPTLHRLGIQAFEPVLIEGKAIRLHPLVCTAFNADFDGDQMAVHVPLSIEAQTEARILMLSSNNLLSPASGKSVVTPTQDILLGIYYLTGMWSNRKGEGTYYADCDDVLSAIDHGVADINAKIWLKVRPEWNIPDSDRVRLKIKIDKDTGQTSAEPIQRDDWEKEGANGGEFFRTSPGRVLFNQSLDENMRFKNLAVAKSDLSTLLDETYDKCGQHAMVEMLDSIKLLGYKWSTRSGISLGIGDITVPEEKKEIVAESMSREKDLVEQNEMGLLTEEEYMREKDHIWSTAGSRVTDYIMDHMKKTNPLRMMVDSGARGSKGQVAQMAGIRGLVADPSGRIIDYPIVSNFREGMNMLEYFISTHGARKGLADTALRTAKSGYLTRRLVDVAQDLIITEDDCGTDKGVEVRPLTAEDSIRISLAERITGRILLNDLPIPGTGEVFHKGNEISEDDAKKIEAAGIKSVWVRSPLTCALRHGICRTCYGRDLATRKKIAVGEAVGVVAAQSIGEPGTQLTMRTFHTGGVRQFTGEDITQGLPRIEQLFEVRRPKKVAILADRDGVITEIRETEGKRKIIVKVTNEDGTEESIPWNIPSAQSLKTDIAVGAEVHRGQELTEGYKDPQQLLEINGLEEVQHYLLDGIQDVYRTQGVKINDKHIETILRKVAPVNRVRVMEEGDSTFVAGELVWKDDFEDETEAIKLDNESRLDEAVRFLSGKTLTDIQGGGVGDLGSKYKGVELNRSAVEDILAPGHQISDIRLMNGENDIRVIVGDASFRHKLAEFLLLEDFDEEGVSIKAGTTLDTSILSKVTSISPHPLTVCDTDALSSMEDGSYLAENIVVDGETLASRDSLLTQDIIATLRNGLVKSVKVWKTTLQINIQDEIHHVLIDEYFGKPMANATQSDGGEVLFPSLMVDSKIINGIADGSISMVELEDGELLTFDKLLRKVIDKKAKGKKLLEPVTNSSGEIMADAGAEISGNVIDAIAAAAPSRLIVRASSAPKDDRWIIQSAAFIRRPREIPESRPVVHGVTKAALATDSFLSAASFQQTAQKLSEAAVRGDVDGLEGLKENVIIGLLIPAGTGVTRYSHVEIRENKPEEKADLLPGA
ncbi:DNA-directed RNA polymerase subunit beta' [Synergistales bacterium]|nr:DNA-directed RNA polymerase subunit beta' [Synergistales bacterium]GHV54769.1 DNA-directed RNA polymerase subunit beta' [Synergistales bacterium]